MDGSIPESVYEFREFLYKHPQLIKEVREGKQTWNQLYQDWVILGEDNEEWEPYRTQERETSGDNKAVSGDTLSTVLNTLGQINITDLQKQLSQFSGVMGNVQQVLQHFQKPAEPPKPPRPHYDPFSFRGF
ncbi:spore coat protein YlbD [Salibacterium sp. K-3]